VARLLRAATASKRVTSIEIENGRIKLTLAGDNDAVNGNTNQDVDNPQRSSLKLPKHVHGYIDRLGKPRYYYRRAGSGDLAPHPDPLPNHDEPSRPSTDGCAGSASRSVQLRETAG
jgi:hypothetical protein